MRAKLEVIAFDTDLGISGSTALILFGAAAIKSLHRVRKALRRWIPFIEKLVPEVM